MVMSVVYFSVVSCFRSYLIRDVFVILNDEQDIMPLNPLKVCL